MLIASCSDDLAGNGGKDSASKGDGYIAVKINLPQTKASRALNDKFDDGTENEYAVKSIALLLFEGETAAEATHFAAYDLNEYDYLNDHEETPVDNVTDAYQFLKTVPVNYDTSKKTWGLVLINYNGIGEIKDGKFQLKNGLGDVYNIESLTKQVNSGLSQFVSTENGFFMANIPASENPGSEQDPGAEITLLVNMTNTLHDTPQAAREHPAGNFYVERAVAKATLHEAADLEVSISGASAVGDHATKEEATDILSIESVEWGLSNTEPTSYFVRNLGDDLGYLSYANNGVLDQDLKYRMVGNQKLGKTTYSPFEANLYRTYWCVDPAYDKAGNKTNNPEVVYVDDEKTVIKEIKPGFNFITANKATDTNLTPAYCHENTFDVAHQNHQNTTRVVLKVQMNGGDTFYTVNGRQDLLYTSEEDATAGVYNYLASTSIVEEAVKKAAVSSTQTETIEGIRSLLTVSFTRDRNGMYVASNVEFNDNWKSNDKLASKPEFKEGDVEALCEQANQQYQIAQYEGGVNYYNIWVKHFAGSTEDPATKAADDLAPWTTNAPTVEKTLTTADAYPGTDAENNWLGRYGMVRNNWYDITVSKILHLGTPEITDPSVDVIPDDEKDTQKYVAFTINVLSWAKRTQSVVL